MKKLLGPVILGLFLIFSENVNALDLEDFITGDSNGEKLLNSIRCKRTGFLEFPDGFFCPERAGHWNKLTKERFQKKRWEGTYYYLNGDRFEGEFIHGRRLKGYLVKKGSTLDESQYIGYWRGKGWEDRIYYSVPYALNKWGDCEFRPYSILTFRMKRINPKAYIGDSPFDKKKDFRLAKNKNEFSWCFHKYGTLGPFVVKNEYKIYIIVFIVLGVFINVVLLYFFREKKKKKNSK